MALLLLGGAIALVPVARADPVPPATVQFTHDGAADGSVIPAPCCVNASEVIFTGQVTVNFTFNGIPLKPFNIQQPVGATDLMIFWVGFVIDGACWTGSDRSCLNGGDIQVPTGANDRNIKSTDFIRGFDWGTASVGKDGTRFHTVETVPVPSDANGDELVLATTSVSVPQFPLSGLLIVVGLSAVVLAYYKRGIQYEVA
jgi:hypothetical protein